jgi:hypothetical protein
MSQETMYWSDLAELTHKTQVEKFNFCLCEEGEQFPYSDCPVSKCLDCGERLVEGSMIIWAGDTFCELHDPLEPTEEVQP